MAEAIDRCPTCFLNWEINAPVKISGQNAYCCVNCKAVYSGEMLAARAMLAALRETTAEAIRHRKDIIDARAAGFHNINDEKFRQAYDQEIAHFDALIDRANAAISQATGEG